MKNKYPGVYYAHVENVPDYSIIYSWYAELGHGGDGSRFSAAVHVKFKGLNGVWDREGLTKYIFDNLKHKDWEFIL